MTLGPPGPDPAGHINGTGPDPAGQINGTGSVRVWHFSTACLFPRTTYETPTRPRTNTPYKCGPLSFSMNGAMTYMLVFHQWRQTPRTSQNGWRCPSKLIV
ncbi:hypothetical protein AMTR_s00033p00203710 [Amborella trichopoda]|uniref:Uncharacterized protein n=1 Tax=Amborella trichopoda TaxID=13333 RepID=U5CMG9_AMBTC|nr:hypothetical protein AMTR_s00033p00203710 [Amborella trichopoda]